MGGGEGRFVGQTRQPTNRCRTNQREFIGDGSASYDFLKPNDDGSLTTPLDSNFSGENWPLGKTFCIPPFPRVPTYEAPEWTLNAPANGSGPPVFEDGPNKLSTWEKICILV
ncbi:MAG: hypothetical protein CM15mP6_4430 [Methanobacteriota archaeon]|nr:MAG: hypothetical protein CM15mP6_4430 [Euryarchaeota archaeon]